ncbi:branched-chain amino acid ABC transporter permease [Candidatus Aerophobetes bacterium]|nr:branched-chain amino acid ABC transporter permease [Candidatus Aerophobetes bacterium]
MSGGVFLQIAMMGIYTGSLYALIAIGLTLIFGVLEIVNFAHGEFLMLSMYGSFWLMKFFGLSPYLSFFILVPVFFLIGAGIEYLLIQPIVDKPFTIQICVTLGLSLILSRGALLAWGPGPRVVKSNFASGILNLSGVYLTYGEFLMFVISIFIIMILFLFLYKTYTGKAIRAVAQGRIGAKLLGINVSRIYLLTFGIGIACVAAAGVIMSPVYTAIPSIGTTFVMLAFIIVVLGGYKSLLGTLLGAFILAFIEVFTSFLITPHLKEAVMFGIFILILLWRPSGLLKSK